MHDILKAKLDAAIQRILLLESLVQEIDVSLENETGRGLYYHFADKLPNHLSNTLQDVLED